MLPARCCLHGATCTDERDAGEGPFGHSAAAAAAAPQRGKGMTHIFADPSEIGDTLRVRGADFNHIKNVLRMRPGEELSVSDGSERTYLYRIEQYAEGEAVLSLVSAGVSDAELPVHVTLFQGLPKGDRMDFIVQKCTELGCDEFVPVEMERCVMKLEGSRREKKREHWQSVAESAAEQSRRTKVPAVQSPVSMKEALRMAGNYDIRILPYEKAENGRDTREILGGIRPGQSIAVFIGPEGGFSPAEVEEAKKAGCEPVTLGHRILRTETAGMCALSFLVYRMEIEGAGDD